MNDLFGKEVILPPTAKGSKKEKIAVHQYKQLISIYGKGPEGKRCVHCLNCQQHQGGSKRFYKCHLAKVSHSAATDWNSRWEACGKFELDPNKKQGK